MRKEIKNTQFKISKMKQQQNRSLSPSGIGSFSKKMRQSLHTPMLKYSNNKRNVFSPQPHKKYRFNQFEKQNQQMGKSMYNPNAKRNIFKNYKEKHMKSQKYLVSQQSLSPIKSSIIPKINQNSQVTTQTTLQSPTLITQTRSREKETHVLNIIRFLRKKIKKIQKIKNYEEFQHFQKKSYKLQDAINILENWQVQKMEKDDNTSTNQDLFSNLSQNSKKKRNKKTKKKIPKNELTEKTQYMQHQQSVKFVVLKKHQKEKIKKLKKLNQNAFQVREMDSLSIPKSATSKSILIDDKMQTSSYKSFKKFDGSLNNDMQSIWSLSNKSIVSEKPSDTTDSIIYLNKKGVKQVTVPKTFNTKNKPRKKSNNFYNQYTNSPRLITQKSSHELDPLKLKNIKYQKGGKKLRKSYKLKSPRLISQKSSIELDLPFDKPYKQKYKANQFQFQESMEQKLMRQSKTLNQQLKKELQKEKTKFTKQQKQNFKIMFNKSFQDSLTQEFDLFHQNQKNHAPYIKNKHGEMINEDGFFVDSKRTNTDINDCVSNCTPQVKK